MKGVSVYAWDCVVSFHAFGWIGRLHERFVPEPYYCGSIMYRRFGPIRLLWVMGNRYVEVGRIAWKVKAGPYYTGTGAKS